MLKKEAYQILSDLVYKGFLAMNAEIAGKFFVFKTVNQKEHDLIKIYSGLKDEGYTNRFNILYLIFSLFMFEKENIIQKREEEIKGLFEFFSGIPNQLIVKILEELSLLRDLSFEATSYVEGFSYTNQSRKMWKFISGNPLNDEKFTGIRGTNRLGLNTFQENWVLINKMLDEEEHYNQQFSLALLIASASNPKGCRSVRGKFDATVRASEQRRRRLAREGSSEKAGWSPTGWAAPVDTAEELVAELERQMSGKKDKHDLFIEEHMRKLKEKADERKREAEQKLKEIRERRTGEEIPITVTQRILTPEETKELVLRKPSNLIKVKSDEIADEEEKERFYSKIGTKILTARK